MIIENSDTVLIITNGNDSRVFDRKSNKCYIIGVCKCFVGFRLCFERRKNGEVVRSPYKVNQNNKKKKMAKKLYVGGLPYASNEEAVKEHFSQAGTVESVNIINDKMTGRSKGFGFVEMSSDEEAQKAIDMFHGKEFEGRTLTVNEARPLEERPKRDFDGGSRY